MKRLWVVEMRNNGRWEPTTTVGLTRGEGREHLRDWQADCPNFHFRLVAYIQPGGGQ